MPEKIQQWKQQIEEHLAPFAHKIPYGNLRFAFTDALLGEAPATNLAMVYEVPGGSTNQINVIARHDAEEFHYLSPDDHEERITYDPEEVTGMLEQVARSVPELRRERLREEIQRWFGEGRSRQEMFVEINKLLQMDFKGGSITHHELKESINYILELGGAKEG